MTATDDELELRLIEKNGAVDKEEEDERKFEKRGPEEDERDAALLTDGRPELPEPIPDEFDPPVPYPVQAVRSRTEAAAIRLIPREKVV